MEKLLLGLLFIALGAFAVFVSLFSLARTRRFAAEASSAFGDVIALRECGGSRRATYAPVVRFAPPGGRPVEFTDATSSNPPGYRVGDRVNVLYRRDDPTDARVASPVRLYLHEVVFAAAGLVFFVIGSALVYSRLSG
jgi:hypothetical protein